MSEPLKPCAKGHPAERFRTPSGTAVIACHKCGIRLAGVKKEITALWNRPGEEALRAEIAVLTSKLQIAEGKLEGQAEFVRKYMRVDLSKGDK